MRLRNGTIVEIGPEGMRVTLPGGRVVEGSPRDDQAEQARWLGYGDDIPAMVRDHDPLHALLTDWLRLPMSFALALQAGGGAPRLRELAEIEEYAVMGVQRLMKAAGVGLPK